MESPTVGVFAYLADIPDPRGRKGRRHSLQAMLVTIVCSVLCGARGFAAIARWIHCQEPEFHHLLGFTRKPPTENAFRDLLLAIDPEGLEEALVQWVSEIWMSAESEPFVSTRLPAESIDGKVVRGALGIHGRAMCLLTRVDQATGRVLSQIPVDNKTNEAKTALLMLKQLIFEGQIKGRVIVGDAAFCQRDICQTIHDAGGYYLLDVKENQPTLLRECQLAFIEKRAFSPLPQKTLGSERTGRLDGR